MTDTTEKHPSYAMIRLSKPQGGSPNFFGSPANSKGSHMSIEIAEGEMAFSGGYPIFHGSLKSIIRIRMTHAQFVAFVQSEGQGNGTPCTIERRMDMDGTRHEIEEPPAQRNDTDRVKTIFEKKCKGLARRLGFYQKQVDQILDKKSLTKADKQAIRDALSHVSREVGENMPHVADLFHESTDKIVGHARQEIDAVVNSYVKGLGVEALKAGFGNLLGGGDKKDEQGQPD